MTDLYQTELNALAISTYSLNKTKMLSIDTKTVVSNVLWINVQKLFVVFTINERDDNLLIPMKPLIRVALNIHPMRSKPRKLQTELGHEHSIKQILVDSDKLTLRTILATKHDRTSKKPSHNPEQWSYQTVAFRVVA